MNELKNKLKEKLANWARDNYEGSTFAATMHLHYIFRIYAIDVLHLSIDEYKSAWNEIKKILDI